MAHSFWKFISEVFVNGKFPKISCYMVCTITKCMQQLLSYSTSAQENSSLGCHVIRCNSWLLHGTSYLVSVFLHFGVADTSWSFSSDHIGSCSVGKSSAWIPQKTYNPLSQPDYTFSSMTSSYLHETDPRALNHHKLPVRTKLFSCSNSVTYIESPLMSPGWCCSGCLLPPA